MVLSAEMFQLDDAAGRRRDPIDLAHEQPFALGSLAVAPALRQVTAADETRQTLEPRVMQVLVALHRANGGIVSRDDLIRSCWRGTVVGEDSINRTISLLRRLSEGIGRGDFHIETIPRVGYRLLRTDTLQDAAQAGPERTIPAPPRRLILAVSALLLLALAAAFVVWRTIPQGPVYSLSVQSFRAPGGSAGFEDMLSSALTTRNIPTAGGQTALALTGSIENGTAATRITVRLMSSANQDLIWSSSTQLSGSDPTALASAAAALGAVSQCTLSFANDAGHALAPDLLSRFARACELMIRGDAEQSLGIARQLTRQAPDFAGGWFLRANQSIALYFRTLSEIAALRQEAQTAAEKLAALRPTAQESPAYLALAMAPERAVEREQLLRRAATLEPIFANVAQAYLGDFLMQTGRLEEAFQLYRANAQRNPSIANRQVQLFFASAATGRWPIVDEALGRIRQLDPTSMPNLLWRQAVWRSAWTQAETLVPLELPAQEQAGIATYRALASGDPGRKDAAARLVMALPNRCCLLLRIEMLTLLDRTSEAIALLDGFDEGRTPGRRPGNIGLFLWDPALRPMWFDPGIEPFLQRNGWIAYWRASRSQPDLCGETKAPAFCRLLRD